MNARPDVRNLLIKKKMKRWLAIVRCYPHCQKAQARRNFLRLIARHPEIAQELGYTIISAYE
jgi:hypothetical protein